MSFKALNALQLFTKVAQHPSYSAAAQALHMTKGAVSYQMAMLEDELGFKVFCRQPRGVTLTNQGQELLIHSKNSLRYITQAIAQLSSQYKDQLTVGMSSYFAARWLSPRLMDFMQQHPSATLKLQPMIDLEDFLNEGIDIAIRWGNGHWSDAVSEELFNCPVMACAGPLSAKKVTSDGLSQVLQSAPLLQDREGSGAWQAWHKAAGLPYHRHITHLVVPDPNVRRQTLIDGQGMGLYDVLAQAEIDAGSLICVSPVRLNNYGYYLVYDEAALNKPAVMLFRQWILDAAQQWRVHH